MHDTVCAITIHRRIGLVEVPYQSQERVGCGSQEGLVLCIIKIVLEHLGTEGPNVLLAPIIAVEHLVLEFDATPTYGK